MNGGDGIVAMELTDIVLPSASMTVKEQTALTTVVFEPDGE